MLARGALCRLAAEAPKQATHDLPKLAALVQTARSGFSLPIRMRTHVSQLQTRLYATTKAAKDPAAPVKKAVKAKAAAGEKVTKTTTTKKPAARKAAAKKPAAKKPAAKKTRGRAKKAAPKKKPAKKPKKLTDEEKQKAVIKRLKEIALREPVTRRSISSLNVFIADQTKDVSRNKATLAESAKSFHNLSPAEREKWNHLAAERNEARVAEYKAWVVSHTPDQIRLANNARIQLKRKLAGTQKRGVPRTQYIVDDRRLKRPLSSWTFFFSERTQSPDFKGIATAERSKLISQEWKALSAGEKQRFEDLSAADKQRYEREAAASEAA